MARPSQRDIFLLALGTRVAAARHSAGLTLQQLAERIGHTGRSYVSDLERGRKNANIDGLRRIAAALRIPLSDLMP